MPVFVYEGKNRQGVIRKGEVEAANEGAVIAQLRAQQILPMHVKAKPKDVLNLQVFQPKILTKDIVIFTRQFATMIDAGLPLVQCLDILSTQSENPTFKKVLVAVKQDVEGGSTFTDALGHHPKVFDNLYVNLVAAGEIGGILDTILNRLAAYMEKNEKLKKRVKGAMVYPVTILVIAFAVVVALLIFVVPVFERMFHSFGSALPAPTQFVIDASHFLQTNVLFLFVGIVVSFVGFKQMLKTESGRRGFDRFILHVPIFGMLLKKVAIARFSRTLGTMISSGVPILDALDIVAKTAGNKTVEEEVYAAREGISQGKKLAEPFANSRVFPPMVVQMIAVGEETGAMEAMLNKIADFYDDEVDAAVNAMTAMLEPIFIVLIGGIVGGLLVAMYLPIFKIADVVG